MVLIIGMRSIAQQVDIWQSLAGHLAKKPGFNLARQAKTLLGNVTIREKIMVGADLSAVPTLYFHSYSPLSAWEFYIQALSLSSGLRIHYDFLFEILQNTLECVLDYETKMENESNRIVQLDFSRRDNDILTADEAVKVGRFAGFEALACLCQSIGLIQELTQHGLELTGLRIGHRHEYVPVLFSREDRLIIKAMPIDKRLACRRAIIL